MKMRLSGITAAAFTAIAAASLTALCAVGSLAAAQDRGANLLAHQLAGLGVTARVLMIGAHPDDEDTQMLAFLARGRHVETAYLSLTRGDGGQNRIGNELGEGLGAIRTEELLAARRVDGAKQFFTRAYDFGFSKSADESFRHWHRESLLRDVVTVVRAFRPHIIVAVFSGTPRDGHGHHQVAGILAREAFDAAATPTTMGLPAWSPLKLYQTLRGSATGATVELNVGEYSPVLGRSYAEIAGESRSQHKSQGFGSLEPRGARMGYAQLERSRIGPVATAESSLFGIIDTTWNRFRELEGAPPLIDRYNSAVQRARAAYSPWEPELVIEPLAEALDALNSLCVIKPIPPNTCAIAPGGTTTLLADMETSVIEGKKRVQRAIVSAAGVSLEATVPTTVVPPGGSAPVSLTVYNRGSLPITVIDNAAMFGGTQLGFSASVPSTVVAAGGTHRLELGMRSTLRSTTAADEPWWLRSPRQGAMFADASDVAIAESDRLTSGIATVNIGVGAARVRLSAPITHRFADPVIGEVERHAVVAPVISVTLDREVEFVAVGSPVQRTVLVAVTSAASDIREVTVTLQLPAGLTADSASRTVRLAPGGKASVRFNLSGSLAVGSHLIRAVASSSGESFTTGYTLVDYPHIRQQRLYRNAHLTLQALDIVIPAQLKVAYVPGVGDNIAPVLQQLGVRLTIIPPTAVAAVDLSLYTTIVIGPRAYDASPELVAANEKLFAFVRAGGTMLVQFGQNMDRPGVMPFPVGASGNQERVTEEDSPVAVLEPAAPLLNSPNRITTADFAGWVQERATYMPRTRDSAYKPLLAMNDTGEAPLDGGLLVARLGEGTFIYCGLALFRQIPAGVPGAARLMVNLMSGGLQ